ncbi:MAG: rhomboid family intramembrane serine protease [Chthoniobacterales bacterium]
MIDLGHILLFVAIVSPLAVLFRTARRGGDPGWRRVALLVLFVTGITWSFRPNYAGFVGGAAWFLLLFLPAIVFRKAAELARIGRFGGARRALGLLRPLHPAAGLREHVAFIDAMETQWRTRGVLQPFSLPRRNSIFGDPAAAIMPGVMTLVTLNVAMFIAEIALGGSTNSRTLHRLGALEPYPVLAFGQYWRFITAPFLHYGSLHLFLNIFALYYFGRTLESAIGTLRFMIVYIVAGIGSCAEVALLWRFGWLHADQLVGASGAVMGVVGAWAGLLLRDRREALASQRLQHIASIVVIQTVFDIITPQVSMAAHLGGFTTGLLAGFALAPSRRAQEPAAVGI